MSEIKGYKVFNPDWTCKGFQYEVGKSYEMEEQPVACKQGFHFCEKLEDCYSYYNFAKNNKVAEIIAYGDIDIDINAFGKEYCTNKIKIERALSWEEVFDMVNIGKNCIGFGNTGNRNRGVCNTGSFNDGNLNSGYYNREDCNSGNDNAGNYNSGNFNLGDYNSGTHNHGDYNAGDYNATNDSGGCFNTEPTEMFFFNKLSNWTRENWEDSRAKFILDSIMVSPVKRIYEENMTDNEKEAHPEYQITGFYLKELTQEEMAKKNQKNWNKLSQKEKDIVMAIPNFDKAIFKEITGIDVDK